MVSCAQVTTVFFELLMQAVQLWLGQVYRIKVLAVGSLVSLPQVLQLVPQFRCSVLVVGHANRRQVIPIAFHQLPWLSTTDVLGWMLFTDPDVATSCRCFSGGYSKVHLGKFLPSLFRCLPGFASTSRTLESTSLTLASTCLTFASTSKVSCGYCPGVLQVIPGSILCTTGSLLCTTVGGVSLPLILLSWLNSSIYCIIYWLRGPWIFSANRSRVFIFSCQSSLLRHAWTSSRWSVGAWRPSKQDVSNAHCN